jgi:hypothetical protein
MIFGYTWHMVVRRSLLIDNITDDKYRYVPVHTVHEYIV